jgi:hypothetical protein
MRLIVAALGTACLLREECGILQLALMVLDFEPGAEVLQADLGFCDAKFPPHKNSFSAQSTQLGYGRSVNCRGTIDRIVVQPSRFWYSESVFWPRP